MITKRAKRAQRAHCVKLVRARAEAIMDSARNASRPLQIRATEHARATELRMMADILARDPIV